jgi:hypothetical protein
MNIPRIILSGRLTHTVRDSGAHTFTCGDSEDVLLIFDPQTYSVLTLFEGRRVDILVCDSEPPTGRGTDERQP